MSTLPPCADHGNDGNTYNPTTDYLARPSGCPDEATLPFEDDHALHRAVLAEHHHEQAVDAGDDAVNADMAQAERRLRAAFPRVDGLWITREQERFGHDVFGTAFVTRWRVVLSDLRRAEGETLEEAVEALLAHSAPTAAAPIAPAGPESHAIAG